MVFYICIFAVSGLLINHGEWKFAGFWEQREERKTEFTLPVISLVNGPEVAQLVKEKLTITGETENFKMNHGTTDFRIHSPGVVRDIHIDRISGTAVMKELKFNSWGKLKNMHMFNGINKSDLSKSPNWIVTRIWRFTMDFTAIALIILCLGGWALWYQVRKEYKAGYFILAFSLIVSGYFIFLIDLF